MTYSVRKNVEAVDARKIYIDWNTHSSKSVHFEPFDGMGAGRMARVCSGDIVEFVEKNAEGWIHIRSIIIEDLNNIHHFDGWIRPDGVSFSRGNGLGDLQKDREDKYMETPDDE